MRNKEQNPWDYYKPYQDIVDEQDVRDFRKEMRKSSRQSHRIAVLTLIIAIATLIVSIIAFLK